MAYEVWNRLTGESHGAYETLGEAHGCVAYDRIKSYQIELTGSGAVVERCEDVYHGDDQRVREAMGQPAFPVPVERPRTVARSGKGRRTVGRR